MAQAFARARRPFEQPPGDLHGIRENLSRVMWEDAGIIRTHARLCSARSELAAMHDELAHSGLASILSAFNLDWQLWLDMDNLLLVSRAIVESALNRTDSRGAHFRTDHPDTGSLEESRYTTIRMTAGEMGFHNGTEPVDFSRIRPGESFAIMDEGVAATPSRSV